MLRPARSAAAPAPSGAGSSPIVEVTTRQAPPQPSPPCPRAGRGDLGPRTPARRPAPRPGCQQEAPRGLAGPEQPHAQRIQEHRQAEQHRPPDRSGCSARPRRWTSSRPRSCTRPGDHQPGMRGRWRARRLWPAARPGPPATPPPAQSARPARSKAGTDDPIWYRMTCQVLAQIGLALRISRAVGSRAASPSVCGTFETARNDPATTKSEPKTGSAADVRLASSAASTRRGEHRVAAHHHQVGEAQRAISRYPRARP